jgi:hypothetical protein
LLSNTIADIHARSRAYYGMRRIRATLAVERGLIVNKKFVTKIMHELKIEGLPATKKGRRNLVNVATYEDGVIGQTY